MYFEDLTAAHACRNAKIVLRACKDMGLIAVWVPSRRSESEYVEVWENAPRTKVFKVRFSDHSVADQYRDGHEEDYQFEVAWSHGHAEVAGNCYHAIVWLTRHFSRELPRWIPDKYRT